MSCCSSTESEYRFKGPSLRSDCRRWAFLKIILSITASWLLITLGNYGYMGMASFLPDNTEMEAISSALRLWIIIEDSLHILCV